MHYRASDRIGVQQAPRCRQTGPGQAGEWRNAVIGEATNHGVMVNPLQRQRGGSLGQRASAEPQISSTFTVKHTHIPLSSPRSEWEQNDGAGNWVVVRTSCGGAGGAAPHCPWRRAHTWAAPQVPTCKADTGCRNEVLQHVLSARGQTTLSPCPEELQLSCTLLEHTNLIFQGE